MKLNRSLFVLAVLLQFSLVAHADLASIIAGVQSNSPAAVVPPRRTSIVFIQCTGLGYGDLSCYGQTNFQTPNLDRLAAEGMRFTHYGAASTNLFAVQAALLTGANAAGETLASDAATVAQKLQSVGYHTGWLGEWDLGDATSPGAPWKNGFDEFVGYLNPNEAGNFYADFIWSLPAHVTYDPTSGQWVPWKPGQGSRAAGREMIYVNTKGKNEYVPDLLTKASLNFIKNNQPDQFNHYQPFFLVLHFTIPGQKIEVPTDAPFSGEAWPQPEKNKAALISRIDGYVGQVQEQLQNIGLTNRAVIFIAGTVPPVKTSETDPVFFHSNISTNDLRVPMIVHWPESVPAGRVSNLPWSAPDFAPTVLQIGFARPAASFTGISVLPTLLGQVGTTTNIAPPLLDRSF